VTEQERAELPAGWDTYDRRHTPFEPGNTVGMRHGTRSLRMVNPIAQELISNLLADDGVAYLRQPRWAAAVEAWGRCEARIELLLAYIAGLAGEGELGDLGDPKVVTAYRLLERFEASAVQQRGRLGLDPLSAARLGRDKAAAGVDIAKLMARLAEQDEEDEDA
jgi:hypothetical protein